MSGLTTFLFGAVIGGGAKWAYDVYRREDTSSEVAASPMIERSAEHANNLRQSAATNLSDLRKSAATGLQTAREKSAERATNLRTRLNNPLGATPDSVAESDSAADDASELEVIHGIGPVFSSTLAEAGITTLSQLAEQSVESIVAILDAADLLRPANVESWPEQAAAFANA